MVYTIRAYVVPGLMLGAGGICDNYSEFAMRRLTWREIGHIMGTRPEPVWALLLCGLIMLALFAADVPVAGWLKVVTTVMLFGLAAVAWLEQ